MKIYTKTGDDGSTALIGGRRVAKSDARIDCYGNVDELNASIGWAAVGVDLDLAGKLRTVQNELFVIGSHLAIPDGEAAPTNQMIPPLSAQMVPRLEAEIDAATAALPALQNFILPGGTETSARLHVARTVCRRAERALVGFAGDHPVDPMIVTYLNRLSDWLFVYARLSNQNAGAGDVPWTK